MIIYSYLNGLILWGFAIFFFYDINEVLLNLSRFLNEFESTKGLPATILFILTVIVWFIL